MAAVNMPISDSYFRAGENGGGGDNGNADKLKKQKKAREFKDLISLRDPNGDRLCWDFARSGGCKKAKCSMVHAQGPLLTELKAKLKAAGL